MSCKWDSMHIDGMVSLQLFPNMEEGNFSILLPCNQSVAEAGRGENQSGGGRGASMIG